jgi:hypothetical protein
LGIVMGGKERLRVWVGTLLKLERAKEKLLKLIVRCRRIAFAVLANVPAGPRGARPQNDRTSFCTASLPKASTRDGTSENRS